MKELNQLLERLDEELKPCPFCGEIPEILKNYATYAVSCNAKIPNCTTYPSTTYYYTSKEAIAAWNKRAEQCK